MPIDENQKQVADANVVEGIAHVLFNAVVNKYGSVSTADVLTAFFVTVGYLLEIHPNLEKLAAAHCKTLTRNFKNSNNHEEKTP